jgi:basic amino acid/polyamine antiporter, APA family
MNKLVRGLSLFDSLGIVIGTIIGTGVFLKTANMSQATGNPYLVLLAWAVAGLLSFCGALAYAELGTIMPDAGGEYVYLKKGYGDMWAFLFGWMRFWIGAPGSIAAYSVASMTFFSTAIDLDAIGGKQFASIAMIIFFSLLNCLKVSLGGRIQGLMSSLKLISIFGLMLGIFFFSGTGTFTHLSESTVPVNSVFSFLGISSFATAMLGALWAFDGWNNLSMIAGEIKNPQKNIPLSFGLGLIVIFLTYALINLAYFYALPFSEVLSANSGQHPGALPVATKAALTFLGTSGVIILALMCTFSGLSSMNASIMTNSRVPYAMAESGLFFKSLSRLSPTTHVPVIAIFIQAILACILVLSGTFDQLTNYVLFSSWIFYAMVTSLVFVMRKKMPTVERRYKTLEYPVLPGLFIILGILLLINTLYTMPIQSGIGLFLILLGVPFYLYFKKIN